MEKVFHLICSSCLVLAFVFIFLEPSCCSATEVASSQIDNLKAQFLPPEYRNTNFSVDDIKKIFQEKCKKSTGTHNATLYKEIEEGAKKFTTCVSGLANITLMQEEIEAARPIGELDTVFQKYCQKAPELKICLNDFNEKVQPCLTQAERQQNVVFMRIVNSLITFMCDKGGDHIALFIAEEGPECLEANKEAITNCANRSFSEYLPKDGHVPNLMDFSDIVLSPEHCIDFERFESCTLHHLEQCQEITPANIAESVFKFVKNETSCRTWIDAKANQRSVLKDPKSGSQSALRSVSILGVTLGSLFTMMWMTFIRK